MNPTLKESWLSVFASSCRPLVFHSDVRAFDGLSIGIGDLTLDVSKAIAGEERK